MMHTNENLLSKWKKLKNVMTYFIEFCESQTVTFHTPDNV